MNRLQLQCERLYTLPDIPGHGPIDVNGSVRVVVLELARPADWPALSAVWQGVQADLELPAPAIAVNGRDGYQLWFSLQQPVPLAQAQAFGTALQARYLGTLKPGRVRVLPGPGRPAEAVPAQQGSSGLWSAFVAPDLAPVFADEPWLDTPPNDNGQAELLAALTSIAPDDWHEAMQRLLPGQPRPADLADLADLTPAPAPAPAHAPAPAPAPSGAGAARAREPRQFLLDVMNDERVDLALRIDAAKALLRHDGSA